MSFINTTISTKPFLLTSDPYEYMKTKTGNKVRYTGYISILWNTLLDMFEYENLPDTIPKRFLETILHSTGEVFVSKINDKLIASHGTLSGEVDEYGLGTECIAVCPRGESRGERGVDIAYGINNDTATPDMIVYWIAHLLGETDKSIKLNVLYSRLLHIPKVANDKDKAMFEEIVDKLIAGEQSAFVSSNALDLELGAGTETFELTDSNKIDKLPYLTQFFEDCLKRFYNFYGQPMQNQNKRAQSISDEIHGQDSVSFIIPMQMLKCRQALCSEINRIFGTDISVKFSPVWDIEYQALVNRDTNGNGIPDNNESEVNENGNTTGSGEETGRNEKETVKTGDDSTELDRSETETETETDETKTEPVTEPETEPEPEPTDLASMNLEDDKTESESWDTYYTVEEIADKMGVTVEEVVEIMKGGE